jgi:hypothetical protein
VLKSQYLEVVWLLLLPSPLQLVLETVVVDQEAMGFVVIHFFVAHNGDTVAQDLRIVVLLPLHLYLLQLVLEPVVVDPEEMGCVKIKVSVVQNGVIAELDLPFVVGLENHLQNPH